jgi:TolB-like protein
MTNVGGLRERLIGKSGLPRIDAIAVLPLENLSGDPEQEYFADGMTEELTAQLGQLGTLRVISRTSVMTYKGIRKPLHDIAQELNVDAVLEGSVLRDGDRVRITVQLVRASPEEHLWAQSHERQLGNILNLQSEVVQAIAEQIQTKLAPQTEVRLASERSVHPEAYEAYLKGRYYINQRTTEGFERSLEYFQQAVDADPTYALAYAGLADYYMLLPFYGISAPSDGVERGKAAARKALELDDNIAEAHATLSQIYGIYEWSWDEGKVS